MSTTWTDVLRDPISYLMLEDGVSFLLQENSSDIILDQTGVVSTTDWTFVTEDQ